MIVPMKKATIIVQSKDADSALETLRSLGVLHVEHQKAPQGKDISTLGEDIELINEAIRILSTTEPSRKSCLERKKEMTNWGFTPLESPAACSGDEDIIPFRANTGFNAPLAPLDKLSNGVNEPPRWKVEDFLTGFTARHIIDLWKRIDQLKDYSTSLAKNISQWEDWGDFDPEMFHELAKRNVYVRLYQVPVRQIRNFPTGVVVERLSINKGMVNCVVISREKIEVPFKEIPLPKMGLEKMRARLSEDREVIKLLQDALLRQVCYRESLMRIKRSLEKELEFHQALRGMGEMGNIMYLTGYVPYDTVEALEKTAKKESWGVVINEPSDEDSVPTLIRNPRWVSILSPVFKVLEIIPGYRELDISLWFLLFFSIFFGMLIGDAGYGVIYLILTLFIQRKFAKKLPDSSIFGLFYLLSASAIIWGILSGTFFGQEWLSQAVKPLIPSLRNDRNIQTLCFLLGALHLSIAHLWRALIRLPALKALAELGWISILWGAFFLARMLILRDIFPTFGKYLFVLGTVLVVFFTNPRKNFLKGLGAGFGNLLLNLVNNFTDIVSYIRLFAVGLATVAVADAFNKMAGSVGYHSIITGVATSLILLLGHTLNILLGPMSVLVHGVRLNVLEFCNHLDIKWSGFSYKPLKK